MNIAAVALIIWVGFLVLMATGMPIAFAMFATGVIGYLVFVGPQALSNIANVAFSMMTTEMYIAIPLYVMMASIFQLSGLSARL